MQNPAFQRAMILRQQHRYADAANELRNVLSADPHDAQAHAMLALCLAEQDKLKDATAEAQQAVGLAPDSPLAHYALGFALFKRNWLDEALAAARETVRLNSFDPGNFALVAGIEFERRNWHATLEQAENGLAIDPDHVWCTNLRAMALVKLGRKQEAAATLGNALSRDPENAVSHANQGWTLLHAGDHRAAKVHFREALRLDPNQPWAKAGMVEALKSSFFLYRWLLRFFLFMSRLSGRAQWGVILGAYFGYQALRAVAERNPAAAPYLWPILWAYIAFVALTWLAYPLLNLALRLHRFGRYALSRDQIVGSNIVGGLLLLAIVCVIVALADGRVLLLLTALHCVLLMIPVKGAFSCPKGWPRNVMFAVSAGLAALVIVFAIWSQTTTDFDAAADGLKQLGTIIAFGVLGSSFLANAMAQATVRR
jgi:tetratricopeptide (TPR) repeat protein